MDINKLIYFNYAATYLNFSRAAEACYITQAAISKSVKQLETELGTKLFHRDNKKLRLTYEGEQFKKESDIILDHYFKALGKINNDKKRKNIYEGSLSIGYGFFDNHLAKTSVRLFLREYPGIDVSLHRLDYKDMFNSLNSRMCDVVFGPLSRLEYIKDVKCFPLYESDFLCAVGTDNPLSHHDTVRISDLSGETMFFPEADNYLIINGSKGNASKIGISPQKYKYANSTEAMMTMISLDLGITLVPNLMTIEDLDHVKYLKFDPPVISKRMHVAATMNGKSTPSVELFTDFLSENSALICDIINTMIEQAEH